MLRGLLFIYSYCCNEMRIGVRVMNAKDTEFSEYFNRYYIRSLQYVAKRVANPSDAEDITAEAFAKCYERFDSFDPTKASFSTWLYAIIRNKLKNYYRDSKGLDELDENIADNTLMEDEVISAIRLSQLRNQLADALMTLNDLQRQVVVLKYFSDLHSKEIAARLGISPENVRVILSRSIAKLSKIMRLPENEME